MKIILEKDMDLKSLEKKVNEHLERLDGEGNAIKGITYATAKLPVLRGERAIGHKCEYFVMVAYAPFVGV